MTTQREFVYQLHQHARKGGKTHRRRQIQRVWRFLRWAGVPPESVSKRHIRNFYDQCQSATTKRDYYYAMRLMWRALEREGDPPAPK